MADFAKAEFALNARLPDGSTQREHYTSAWEQTGHMPEALANAPPMPPEGAYLWAFFAELHLGRGSNGFGPSPLAFSDIEAWSRMTGNQLDPWELRAILGIDAQYMDSAAEAAKPKGK